MTEAGARKPTAAEDPPELARVLGLALVLTTAIFIAGLSLPPSIATGALYIVPVMISLWTARVRVTLGVAAAGTLLALLELAVHLAREPGAGVAAPLVGGAVAIFAIWVTARLGLWRLAVERDLAESERRTATTFESLAEGVISVDPTGRIVMFNPAAERLTGWTQERARGRPLEEVFRLGGAPSAPATLLSPAAPAVSVETDAVPQPRAGLLLREGRDPVPLEHTSATLVGADGGVLGTVTVFRDVTRRRRYEEAIRKLAYRDEVTGLPNRTSFLDRLQLEMAHARRDQNGLAVLFLDLDGFKRVNDTHGHAAGDRLLRLVAERLTAALRDGDTVARLGGDEFTIILPGIVDREAAELVAVKLRQTLRRPFLVEGELLPVGTSVGIALYPADGKDAEALLERADEAMYREKRGGTRARAARGAPLPAEEPRPGGGLPARRVSPSQEAS